MIVTSNFDSAKTPDEQWVKVNFDGDEAKRLAALDVTVINAMVGLIHNEVKKL